MPKKKRKLAIVTGGNGGIGLEITKALAQQSIEVVIATRDIEKGEARVRAIQTFPNSSLIQVEHLDLTDLKSISSFAERFIRYHGYLDILINNAGVMALPQRYLTSAGVELQFATNHLGPFALTGHLLPLLLKATEARIVTVSSAASRFARFQLDNLQAERHYSPFGAYCLSKLASVMFGLELNDRLRQIGGTRSMVVLPGVAATRLQRHINWGILQRMVPLGIRLIGHEPYDAALPAVFAAADPNAIGGTVISPTGLLEGRGPLGTVKPPKAALDLHLRKELWRRSEQLAGIAYLSED